MNRFSSYTRASIVLALCAIPYVASAQEVLVSRVAPLSPALLPADQKALDEARSLKRLENLWSRPLDWKETDLSLSAFIARVRGSLGDGAPRVDVRTKSAVQATFSLEKSPLGRTLSSFAQLSNCRVWVFFDHLVVAPETALTDKERAAIERGMGGDWTLSNASGFRGQSESWSGDKEELRVCFRIIGTDLKARLAAKAPNAPVPPPVADGVPKSRSRDTAPFELPFGELSPVSQKLLQELVDEKMNRYRALAKAEESSVLLPSAKVCFDDSRGSSHLFLRDVTLKSYFTSWYVFDSK